jgi:hypothetical protein
MTITNAVRYVENLFDSRGVHPFLLVATNKVHGNFFFLKVRFMAISSRRRKYYTKIVLLVIVLLVE